MKTQIFILLLLLLLASCRTQKPVVEVPVLTKIVVKDRAIDVSFVPDSASIKALFVCDSNNQVICTELYELKSKFMNTGTGVISNANGSLSFNYNAHTNQPNKQVTAHDSIVYQDKPIYLPGAAYAVEKSLSWLQKTLIYTGAAAWIILLLFIVTRFFNPLKFIK